MNRRNFVAAGVATATAPAAATAAAADDGYLDTVKELISDWRRKDVDAVMARVTDDIAWHSHVGSPPTLGKAAMRTVLESLGGPISEIRWRIVNHAVNGQQIFIEGVDEFVVTESKRRVAIPYMGIMTFRNGLISEWRDYFDRALFERLKAGEAAPPAVAALADRPGVP